MGSNYNPVEVCVAFMRSHHHVYFDARLPKDDPDFGQSKAPPMKDTVLAVLPDGSFEKIEATKLVVTFQRALAGDEISEVDASLRQVMKAYGLVPIPQLQVDPELTGAYRPSNPRKMEHTRAEIAFVASCEQRARQFAEELNAAYTGRYNEIHPVCAGASLQLAKILDSHSNGSGRQPGF